MLHDALAALDEHLDALAYVGLVVLLIVVAIHADKRYDQERTRNEILERRIRSLTLVVKFQDTMLKAIEPAAPMSDEPAADVLDLSVDAMISRLGYCLTCHKLKAPDHFVQTHHLQLEDENLVERERH